MSCPRCTKIHLFASSAIPTQMTSYEVVERGAACAIAITASHNPWTDNGFKMKSATGAAASPDILEKVERVIADRAGSEPPRRPSRDPYGLLPAGVPIAAVLSIVGLLVIGIFTLNLTNGGQFFFTATTGTGGALVAEKWLAVGQRVRVQVEQIT